MTGDAVPGGQHPEGPTPAPAGPDRRVDGPPVNAWRVLGRALRPRPTRAQLLSALLCALLGFAIAVQVRQTDEVSMSTMRQSELVSLLDQTTRQADELQKQANELERTREELRSGSTSREAALEAATRSAAAQGILSGRLPAEGPGVEITLTEPDGTITAASLLNMLEELRNAGAEAVQLNDIRLTASSYFLTTDDGVEVDGRVVSAPYRWVAIGEPQTLATALGIPGGAVSTVQGDGGRAVVHTEDEVQVTATRTVPAPEFATPVPRDDG